MQGTGSWQTVAGRLRTGIREALVLVTGGLILGVAVQEIRCSTCPWVQEWSVESVSARHLQGVEEISLEEATARHLEGSVLYLDARDPGSFRAGHLPGAMNVPPQEAEAVADEVRTLVDSGLLAVAYCDGLDCPLSTELARALQALGVPSVRVLVNGWSRWREAGLPTERG
jgi:3-mercaptopyruvate sulfurtransferase SseA